MRFLCLLIVLFGCSHPKAAVEPAKLYVSDSIFPGVRTQVDGYDRFDFIVADHPIMVVTPKKPAKGNPWVWYAEFFGVAPKVDQALLSAGYHIIYVKTPDMFGSPDAMKVWDEAHAELTTKYGLAEKPAFIAASRGGLYAYAWAAAHPDKVSAIVGASPVCDFKSWPGSRVPTEWKKLLTAYHFNDAEAVAYKGNPVDSLAPLAKAKIPLLHYYGTADDVVPWSENTGLMQQRYAKLGGVITVVAMPGLGHDIYQLMDAAVITAFFEGARTK